MRTIGKWFLLLSKRLYKKVSFVILLALIPACVAAFGLVAKQESGFVRVVLAQRPGSGTVNNPVIGELLQEKSGAVLFSYAASPEEAEDAVHRGDADDAWIFPADTAARIGEFYEDDRNYVVQVITREDGIGQRLAREKISASVFEYCAKEYYLEYIRAHVSQLDTVSDEKLLAYFEQTQISEDFFVYRNSADQASAPRTETYLTSPIRGLLAIFVLLGGMAATMYYMQDTAAGTFSLVKERFRGLVALGCVITAVLHISVVALLALCLSSLAGSLLTEIAMLLLYALSCSAFCLLLHALLPGLRSYSVMLPLLTVVMIGVCPVFFDFRSMPLVQRIFPPTYYINGIYDKRNLLYMVLYSVACLLIAWLIQRVKRAWVYRK